MPEAFEHEGRQPFYEKMLHECLTGELRIVNAALPRSQKRLSSLLAEEYPHVVCNDGSTHFFKKGELAYLAAMLEPDEREALPLPMLIEVGAEQGEAAVICQGEIEEKVVSQVLDMPVRCEQRRIRIYRPQLALLRGKLKTTTVYIFSPKVVA